MSRLTSLLVGVIGMVAFFACGAGVARGGVQTFVEDFEGFVKVAGPGLLEIDFETLPDGSPSEASTPITKDFNYDEQGVFFSAPVPSLVIAGSRAGGFRLQAFSEGQIDPTWIDAFLLTPASAVGVFFPGGTIFSAFDTDGDLIVSEQFSAGGSNHFIGFVSNVPIGFTMNNSDPGLEVIQSYVFVPVPEPGCAALLLVGTGLALRGRGRRRT